MMAIVIGVVSYKEHQALRRMGYELASFEEASDLLLCSGNQGKGEHGIAIKIDQGLIKALCEIDTIAVITGAANDAQIGRATIWYDWKSVKGEIR